MKRACIIAGSRPWCVGIKDKVTQATGSPCIYMHSREELTEESVRAINPNFIFFPHWSWIIPRSIWERHECVVFHMTDLPFGRGGSPLQNLIAMGFQETKISALRCEEGLDSGPIYMKRPLSLLGAAEEIFIRANEIIADMIVEMLTTRLMPEAQHDEPVIFKRRTPEQSNLANASTLREIFDHIRMLDAEGYPLAYLDAGKFRIEFSRAALRTGRIVSDVTIRLRENDEDKTF